MSQGPLCWAPPTQPAVTLSGRTSSLWHFTQLQPAVLAQRSWLLLLTSSMAWPIWWGRAAPSGGQFHPPHMPSCRPHPPLFLLLISCLPWTGHLS